MGVDKMASLLFGKKKTNKKGSLVKIPVQIRSRFLFFARLMNSLINTSRINTAMLNWNRKPS